MLSKGITLELISSFKNIHFINFHGFIDPQKFFNNEKFPNYGRLILEHNFLEPSTISLVITFVFKMEETDIDDE